MCREWRAAGPFLGQVFEMLKGSPWDVMTAWSHKYGGIYTFHLFGSDAICISDGDLLKEVLHTQMPTFKKDTGLDLQTLFGAFRERFGDCGWQGLAQTTSIIIKSLTH